MNSARTYLLEALRRVVDGGDLTNDELDAAIAAPADLRGAERKAWHGLSYWADDDVEVVCRVLLTAATCLPIRLRRCNRRTHRGHDGCYTPLATERWQCCHRD